MLKSMKYLLSSVIAMFVALFAAYGGEYDPVADPEAVVVSGNARFTVLTPRLVRMEWSAAGKFEDRATLGIVNRKLDVPAFKVTKRGNKTIIRTDSLTLTYTGQDKFDSDNLEVSFSMTDFSGRKPVERKVSWHPGAEDSGNLLGTTRTLDGCDGVKTKEPYDPGVISRDGWAIIDESERHVLVPDDSDWGEWVAERDSADRLDLYIFAYGHDYKAAISDFTKVAGKIPLPPKFAFGYWWSRYWQYSDFEFTDLARQMRSLDIPIDVMVVDMDWHETWSLRKKNAPKDEYGQRIGWTGYTWQKQLFPNPANFLQDIHNLGMKTSLNLHPASGIQPYEDCYDRFVADYISRTDNYDGPQGYVNEKGEKVSVPFRISDKDWTDAYFNSVIHPLQDMGVDFWWLDWQQWKYCKYMKGLNNTFWLNYTFFNDKVRQSADEGIHAERPMIYHRWGGIGSHRYQIGFSGDTYDTWQVLGYLPYFTATASNVGYGYWGHDIGGHMQKTPHDTDPELYTRWLQYGVFTPIFKTHSTKTRFLERRIWVFPDYFDAMRDAIRLRYTLSPYIYGAARQSYDTGISICRPMYYDYPEEEMAYTMNQQHMFGDDILATVLCEPADSITGLTRRTVWFPEGNDWYDMATGKTYKGGSCENLHYTLNENPYFVKAGAVIPMASETISSLQEKSDELVLAVTPGNGTFRTEVYEDDGETQAYPDEFAITKVTKESDDNSLIIKVAGRSGFYRGMSPDRKVTFVLDGMYAPISVKVNGNNIPYDRFSGDGSWSYDGRELAVRVTLPVMSAEKEIVLECTWDVASHDSLIDGKKGILKRMAAITPEVKYVFSENVDSYQLLPVPFLKVAQCSSMITEDPQNAAEYLSEMDTEAMVSAFEEYPAIPSGFMKKLETQSKL